MKLVDLSETLVLRRTFMDPQLDFLHYTTGDMWTSLAADSGATAAMTTGAGGILLLTSGATDENEVAVISTTAAWLMADDKPCLFEARVAFAEVATDDANVFIGFSSALAADMMQDAGAGPAATFSGFGFYKVENATVWSVISSLATARTTTASTLTAGGAATEYHVFRVGFQPVNATQGECTFLFDGLPVPDANGRPIKHTITYTSAAAMKCGVYFKTGSAASQLARVDYGIPLGLR